MTRFPVRRRTVGGVGILAVVCAVGSAEEALAQACLGNPAGVGGYSIMGGASFSDNATGYSGSGRANLEGPMSIGARVGIVDIDNVSNNVVDVAGDVSYDLPVDGFEACPVIGLGYSTWSDSFEGVNVDLSEWRFPLGLGVGVVVGDDEGAQLIPSGYAGVLHMRFRGSATDGIDQIDESDSETEFSFGGGATVRFNQLFVAGSVSTTTADGADSVLGITVGIVF